MKTSFPQSRSINLFSEYLQDYTVNISRRTIVNKLLEVIIVLQVILCELTYLSIPRICVCMSSSYSERELQKEKKELNILLYQILEVHHLCDFLQPRHDTNKTGMNLSYPRTQSWLLEVQ